MFKMDFSCYCSLYYSHIPNYTAQFGVYDDAKWIPTRPPTYISTANCKIILSCFRIVDSETCVHVDSPAELTRGILRLRAICNFLFTMCLFCSNVNLRTKEIMFEVYNKSQNENEKNKFLGLAIVSVQELLESASQRQVISLQSRPYQNDHVTGTLTLEVSRLQFTHSPSSVAIFVLIISKLYAEFNYVLHRSGGLRFSLRRRLRRSIFEFTEDNQYSQYKLDERKKKLDVVASWGHDICINFRSLSLPLAESRISVNLFWKIVTLKRAKIVHFSRFVYLRLWWKCRSVSPNAPSARSYDSTLKTDESI